MKYRWKMIQHLTLFEKYFKLDEYTVSHELYAGGESHEFTREIFERGCVVAVLPYDPLRREVVLIEQFRAGAVADPKGPWLIESVAGGVEWNCSRYWSELSRAGSYLRTRGTKGW